MRISERQVYIDSAGRRVLVEGRRKVNGGALWVYYGRQVSRDDTPVGDWRMWKSNGRDWSGDINGNIEREASVGMRLDLEATVILERLIEACETDIALPGKIGPKEYGNGMPSSTMTDSDVYVLELNELVTGEYAHTQRRNASISDVDIRRGKCSPQRISRMEEVFGWLGRFVLDHNTRKLVLAYATCKANGGEWDRYVQNHNRRETKENVWIKRTTYRQIAKTLRDIAEILRKRGIILRDGAGLQVAQGEGKPSCKSVSSTVCARREGEYNQGSALMNNPADADSSRQRAARKQQAA